MTSLLDRDFLTEAKIVPNTDTSCIHWGDLSCPWRPRDAYAKSNLTDNIGSASHTLPVDTEFDSISLEIGSKSILSSKYDQVSTEEVAQQQHHLPQRQRTDLAAILQQVTTFLFSGELGCYPHHKVHLVISENTKSFRCREYPVPQAHRGVFKEDLDRLLEIGVLSRAPASKISVSNFRKLNSMITRTVYILPQIQDILK
ncbi:hypothetical protein IV203_015277 [Nitzschia inconspicua]|uniref:Uncharacterized protein n=1 Tax=Nitzschia inconspicua TaxID=303405 RepID=A0A9K3LB23_9STRA|nr:hypothetical protein IV203_020232 [Nitzschia inconspicua]KAG7358688.1 hypothetical protein IV203_015277 [Nitzschia inconspicua]